MRAQRTFFVVAFLCVLALAASGCGSSSDSATKYSGASPDSWAATVCGALSGWVQGLQLDEQELAAEVRSGAFVSIQSRKARVIVFLTHAGSRVDTMIEKVHRVGPPAVKDGEAIQREFEAGLRRIRMSFRRAEKRAKEFSTSDEQSFSNRLLALARDIQKELNATGKAFRELDRWSETLNEATSEEPACDKV